MRKVARNLRTELDGRMAAAVTMGFGAVIVTSFLAVGREGLETSLFIWAAVRATGRGWDPITGAALGLVIAAVLGWLVYRGALTLNLKRFFTWTGAGLIVVAAGVVGYGVHDLQEAGVLPGLSSLAFDVSEQVPPSSWYGTLLKGVLNFSPATTWLEAGAWVAYVVPVLFLYLRRAPRPVPAPARAAVPGEA